MTAAPPNAASADVRPRTERALAPERTAVRLVIGGGVLSVAVFVACLALGGAAARAWLGAAALWAGAPAGAIGMVMMLRLIPGPWRESLIAPLSAAPRMLAPTALAIAPAVIAPGWVYPWVAHPSGGFFREAWLSPGFFFVRTLVWYLLLAGLAWRLRSRPEDKAGPSAGLIAWTVLGGLIAVDWLMSLDPDFASSGFGLYGLSIWMGFAVAIAVASAARRADPVHLDAIGGVLMTSVIFWSYLGFMQYLILWSGDLKPGAVWFGMRHHGIWPVIGWSAVALKMAPGSTLIFYHVRRNPAVLQVVAILIALGAVPELAWLTLPAEGPKAGAIDIILYAVAVIGIGALSLGLCALPRREARR